MKLLRCLRIGESEFSTFFSRRSNSFSSTGSHFKDHLLNDTIEAAGNAGYTWSVRQTTGVEARILPTMHEGSQCRGRSPELGQHNFCPRAFEDQGEGFHMSVSEDESVCIADALQAEKYAGPR
jgi:hypothetical protein